MVGIFRTHDHSRVCWLLKLGFDYPRATEIVAALPMFYLAYVA